MLLVRRARQRALILGCIATLLVYRPVSAERSIIPVPEVITDPNEGTTVGLLGVLLFANEEKSIRSIVAPDVRYNDITGVTPTFRFYDYPDPNQKYLVIAGKGTIRGEYAEAQYSGTNLLMDRLDLELSVQHEKDPFERFFGFGNNTDGSQEANFTSNSESGLVFAGVKLPASFEGSLQSRIRHERVGEGGISSLLQVRDPSSGFSGVKGVEGTTTIVGERFGLAYDTRDVRDIPTEGVFADGGVEVIDTALGSSSSYIKYDLEGKAFAPLRDDKRYILALHGVLDYLQHGSQAAFYEKNSVGGIHSLRGFGSHRFTDNHRFIFQAELRSSVYEREVFGVRAHLEIAPFLDFAKVFHEASRFPIEDLHVVGGVGFRAVVVPQVVAFVDCGTAGGVPAVFTGIDYPF